MAKKAAAQFYGTGRRKKAIARVYVTTGKGNITINGRDIDDYFGLDTLKTIVNQPLVATETVGKYDVKVNVKGGGYTGQAGAIRHGLSRALTKVDDDFRPILKKAGFLTRDPRMKERKKYGLKGALVGSFNNWNKDADPMNKEGNSWKLVKTLEAGSYEYQFVVNDTDWVVDPKSETLVKNKYEGQNSVIVVK